MTHSAETTEFVSCFSFNTSDQRQNSIIAQQTNFPFNGNAYKWQFYFKVPFQGLLLFLEKQTAVETQLLLKSTLLGLCVLHTAPPERETLSLDQTGTATCLLFFRLPAAAACVSNGDFVPCVRLCVSADEV